jgi:hypothetical protein
VSRDVTAGETALPHGKEQQTMDLREKALGLAGVTHGGCPEGPDCRACARNVTRIEAVLAEVAEAARAEERELAAKECEAEADGLGESFDPRDVNAFVSCRKVAHRIRARGQRGT